MILIGYNLLYQSKCHPRLWQLKTPQIKLPKLVLILVNLDSKSRKGYKNLMKPTVVYNEIFLEK